ncbi:MAG: fructosamine kinase family protein [Flavobacteriales bacterium]|nr:fructosamine kinase family protein [Flavobacteriales bacterium]
MQNFLLAVSKQLAIRLNRPLSVLSVRSVGGGSINDAFQLKTVQGDFFVKFNSAVQFPGMFEREAEGLNLLRNTHSIRIPDVLLVGEIDSTAFLVLEWIDGVAPLPNFWYDFGKQLAKLHRHTADQFGLDADNYIGSLPQSNRKHASWVDFLISERLMPQLKRAVDTGHLDRKTVQHFEGLFRELPDIFPTEPPALLHGDLWSGNFMVGSQGEPVIMDPAVYYGHREMDLAMTKLFGGFDRELYQAYHEQHPLEKGWEQRVPVCNLYPLLVHVNLFGGGYVQQVKGIVSKF